MRLMDAANLYQTKYSATAWRRQGPRRRKRARGRFVSRAYPKERGGPKPAPFLLRPVLGGVAGAQDVLLDALGLADVRLRALRQRGLLALAPALVLRGL